MGWDQFDRRRNNKERAVAAYLSADFCAPMPQLQSDPKKDDALFIRSYMHKQYCCKAGSEGRATGRSRIESDMDLRTVIVQAGEACLVKYYGGQVNTGAVMLAHDRRRLAGPALMQTSDKASCVEDPALVPSYRQRGRSAYQPPNQQEARSTG